MDDSPVIQCRWCNHRLVPSARMAGAWDVRSQDWRGFGNFVCRDRIRANAALAGTPQAVPTDREFTWHEPWPPRPDMADRATVEEWLNG